ncbi:MAG: hypothetical protein GC165_11915 [Armatimonadetes bacterium]|nr:hypothetical protein [Armatimonadota bacterium]
MKRMFDKKEDKLFDYAFGELDAHDAQLFEADLLNDKGLKSEVDFLKTMKEDLASFRDVPEMQFSKERLRSAILEQGLKPKKPVSWLNWVLAPSALAGVFALGFVLMNGVNHPEPKFISGPETLATKIDPQFDIKNPNQVDTSLPKKEVKTTPSNPAPTVAMKKADRSASFGETHPIIRSHRSDSEGHGRRTFGGGGRSAPAPTTNDGGGVVVASVNSDVKHDAEAFKATIQDAAQIDKNIMALTSGEMNNDAVRVAFGDSRPMLDSETGTKLIVIDKEQDSGVGAPVATEVNNTANVVIGG